MANSETPSLPAGSTKLSLKDPWLAALLALTLPGLGHFYQGRYFKSVLFCVCILGTYFCGVTLGEGRPVYMYYYSGDGNLAQEYPLQFNGTGRYFNYGYLAQCLVGAPSLPAFIQSKRIEPQQGNEAASDFSGGLQGSIYGVVIAPIAADDEKEQAEQTPAGKSVVPFRGSARLQFQEDRALFTGQIKGVTATGENFEVEIEIPNDKLYMLDRPRMAEPTRAMHAVVTESRGTPQFDNHRIEAELSRPLTSWYQMPLHDRQLNDLHGRLGKTWELAMVLTWIAGLLNVFVIWDAFEGPAHLIVESTPDPKSKPA